MSHAIRYPAADISRLAIKKLASDAQVRGDDATAIEIVYEGWELSPSEAFSTEAGILNFHGDLVTQAILPRQLALNIGEALGDVRLQHVAGEVRFGDVHGELRLQDVAGACVVSQTAADVRADRVADLQITGACDGDLRVDGCGQLVVETVAGDVRVHGAAGVQINRVRGDLWLDKIGGAVQIAQVDGDARLNDVRGPASLAGISGDLRASALPGGLSAKHVSGDVLLSGPFAAQIAYSVAADGDTAVHLPADADVRLSVRATGRIRSDLPLTPAADGSANFTAVLGRGAARINVSGNGDARITQPAPAGRSGPAVDIGGGPDNMADLRNLGERIRQQVTASLAAAGIASYNQDAPPRRPPARAATPERARPPAPASAQEQVAILTMLQEGKVSPEEADLLLRALGV